MRSATRAHERGAAARFTAVGAIIETFLMINKAVIIILDGVGAGELPDAAQYGDEGCNTLGNIARRSGGLVLPNLQRLGLGNILPLNGVPAVERPAAFFARMAEKSPGKDSISGHWELAGRVRKVPPAHYPNGFPPEVMRAFQEKTGRAPLGNKAASGTAIIEELGEEHLRTGRPIIYTSADSVFQIAAHIDIMPPEELYRVCRVVREEIMTGSPYSVDRVIARPFEGAPGSFRRIRARRDFAVAPPYPTLLDIALEHGVTVLGVGKVDDLFGHRGFNACEHTVSNADGLSRIKKLLLENVRNDNRIIILANLIDFDQEYGHRRNPAAFKAGLEEFDAAVPELLEPIGANDLLVITADHGCDPTFERSTDHTREYVPLMAVCGAAGRPRGLGDRRSFADLGATVAQALGLPGTPDGTSFWCKMTK